MTKNVLLSISGLQYDVDDSAPVESVNTGSYYKKNDKHYVLYEEIAGEEGNNIATCSSTCKIAADRVDIIKKGAINTHMIFELNKNHVTYYSTGFGDLLISVYTTSIEIAESDQLIDITLRYNLDINYSHVSECKLHMKIEAAGTQQT